MNPLTKQQHSSSSKFRASRKRPSQGLRLTMLGVVLLSFLWISCEENGPTSYTVNFNTEGGTAIPSQTVEKDKTVTKPADPKKSGFIFVNWYSDAGFTQLYNFTTKVTANITLYAKWAPAYTVTFDTKGGTAIPPQTVAKDAAASKPADPTRPGFTFVHWYSGADSTKSYDFATKVTTNITLYAKWRAKPKPTSFDISNVGNVSKVDISSTLQFSITNVQPADADKRVTWSVEGGAANGAIDTTGLYTAPSTIPTPAQITIKATSVADNAITQTYILTVTNPNWKVIPDPNFRAKLKELIPDAFVEDTLLNIKHTDVTGRTSLSVSGLSIANLEGIQYFTGLSTLECNNNQLTRLDLSKNTALTMLECASNQLTSLNLLKNTNLTRLDCSVNKLASLDLSQNTALTALDCSGNKLASLDLSENTALTMLMCNSNQLTGVSLSRNTALTELNCYNNQLTSLPLPQSTTLTNLNCSHNKLASLDLSKNTALTILECSYNQLASLDLSKSAALTTFSCDSNKLASLDLSQNTALIILDCRQNQLTSLDMRGMRSVSVLNIGAGVDNRNLLTTLKVHKNLRQNSEIKEAKTNRDTGITISWYTAAAGSTSYTQSCGDYNPNNDNCSDN